MYWLFIQWYTQAHLIWQFTWKAIGIVPFHLWSHFSSEWKNPIRTTVITYKLGGGEGNKHEATDNERAWAIHLHKMKAFPEPWTGNVWQKDTSDDAGDEITRCCKETIHERSDNKTR